jgi:hypothetical protein
MRDLRFGLILSLFVLAVPASAQQQQALRPPGGAQPGDPLLPDDIIAGDPRAPQMFDWWRATPVPATTTWGQSVDVRASALMRSWTTMPEYTNRYVDHLPVAPGVISPMDHFGYPIGRPGHLHRVDEIYGYHQALAASSPRVNFQLLGETEEGNHLAWSRLAVPRTLRASSGCAKA